MKTITALGIIITVLLLCGEPLFSAQTGPLRKDTVVAEQQHVVDWRLAELYSSETKDVTKEGAPHIVGCPYGKALCFDGTKDGILLNANPLERLTQFTIEVLFQPDPRAPHEQRFLHMGEANGDRLLLETRVTDDDRWYLDAFIKSGDSSRALVDKEKLHQAGRWYHVALVVDGGTMDTYVNGEHELNGVVAFSPFKKGGASIGVRMNKVSWFKGSIYNIRITPKCLVPTEFMKR
ncbi:MAG: LamG domain-containing protein [Ignavibacteriales bacterium]|nr:LamG domain-containing protein [Ignavibacteriales bacterium]